MHLSGFFDNDQGSGSVCPSRLSGRMLCVWYRMSLKTQGLLPKQKKPKRERLSRITVLWKHVLRGSCSQTPGSRRLTRGKRPSLSGRLFHPGVTRRPSLLTSRWGDRPPGPGIDFPTAESPSLVGRSWKEFRRTCEWPPAPGEGGRCTELRDGVQGTGKSWGRWSDQPRDAPQRAMCLLPILCPPAPEAEAALVSPQQTDTERPTCQAPWSLGSFGISKRRDLEETPLRTLQSHKGSKPTRGFSGVRAPGPLRVCSRDPGRGAEVSRAGQAGWGAGHVALGDHRGPFMSLQLPWSHQAAHQLCTHSHQTWT